LKLEKITASVQGLELGNPHLSIFQPIAPLDAAPQRLYALDKHFKAAADNHNTSGPSLYPRFYGTCRGGFCRGGLFEILRLQPTRYTTNYCDFKEVAIDLLLGTRCVSSQPQSLTMSAPGGSRRHQVRSAAASRRQRERVAL